MLRTRSFAVLALGALCACASTTAGRNPGPSPSTSWTVVAGPRLPVAAGGQETILHGVACPARQDCWAVGGETNVSNYGLVEHFDGRTWTVEPTPRIEAAPGPTPPSTFPASGTLHGLACVAKNDCWAVGEYSPAIPVNTSRPRLTLTEHYDGSSWRVAPSPSTSLGQSLPPADQLKSVACPDSTECWAVGYADGGGGRIFCPSPACPSTSGGGMGRPPSSTAYLIEHFDRGSWVMVTPPADDLMTDLRAVTCLSRSDCWAAGMEGAALPLLLHFDGSRWSRAAMPRVYSELNAVTCVSSSYCWAAGDSTAKAQSVLFHYDGREWMPAPQLPARSKTSQGSPSISGLACRTTSDCWAVGQETLATATPLAAAAFHFDGTRWSAVNPYGDFSQFSMAAFAWAGPSDGWGVGWRVPRSGGNGLADQLLLHWTGAPTR